MSYCRWSSDNWQCDLYCYEDCSGGWTTHVASRRRVGDIPDDRMQDFLEMKITAEEYIENHKAQMEAVGNSELVCIGLPHDGETFNDATLEQFKARLLLLRSIGYRFPDYVLERVEEEITQSVRPEPSTPDAVA